MDFYYLSCGRDQLFEHIVELMQPNVSVLLASDTDKICEPPATF